MILIYKNLWARLRDPDGSPTSREALASFHDRITWDAVLYSLADIDQRPNWQQCVNIELVVHRIPAGTQLQPCGLAICPMGRGGGGSEWTDRSLGRRNWLES